MIPRELMAEIKQGCCVPFLGAGVSTEAHYVRSKFIDEIKKACKYPVKAADRSFPAVMQYYCEKLDGGMKNRLIREVINRIESYAIEGEDNRMVTMFHRMIARVPFFKVFVTTNWDPFLERALNVLIPMVEDRDIPFWADEKRQVLKIHGCVTRPQTLVITSKDYQRAMEDKTKGAVFTRLRDLMATKTFIFVGYSLSDPDFQMLYNEVISNLGEFRRGSWVVDPSPDDRSVEAWQRRGLRILRTSDIAFARELTSTLEKDGIIPNAWLLMKYDQERARIAEAHMQSSGKQDTSGGFASSMYQDGLLHSLDGILAGGMIGKSLDEFRADLGEYTQKLEGWRRRLTRLESKENDDRTGHCLVEIAYCSGRVEALSRFLSNSRSIPTFFNPEKLRPAVKPVYHGKRKAS
jgi:hypothetical protein